MKYNYGMQNDNALFMTKTELELRFIYGFNNKYKTLEGKRKVYIEDLFHTDSSKQD